MHQTGTYVSLSRAKLGPEPEPRVRTIQTVRHDPSGTRYVGVCDCGWRSGPRRARLVAWEALDAHTCHRS